MEPKTFKLLQEQDWEAIGKELIAFAAWRAWNYKWRRGGSWDLAAGKTVEDLVQDVIVKTIEGVRRWDPDKGELMPWLMRQLTSVIDHLYRSEPHRYEVAIPESEDGEELSNKIDYHASRVSNLATIQPVDPEEIVLKKEEIEQRENALFQAVNGDPELEAILEAITSGCKPKARYLADKLGVPVEDIYNRLRRLRRRASKLMKGENL